MYGRRLSVWKWHVLTNRWATDSVLLWSNKHRGSHKPFLSERYSSVSSIPTHFDFITDHIITYGGANHWDGWTVLHLHKHATLWRYPVKRHHIQPIQRWIAKRMIGAVIHLHTSAPRCTLMHADGRNAWSGSSVGMHMHTSACIWIHMDTHACICMQSQSRMG